MSQEKGKTAKTASHFNSRRQSRSAGHHDSVSLKPNGGDEQHRDDCKPGISAKQGGLSGYKIPKLKVSQFLYVDNFNCVSVKQEVKSPSTGTSSLPPSVVKLSDSNSTPQRSLEGDTGRMRIEQGEGSENNRKHKENQDEEKAVSGSSTMADSSNATMTPKELVKKALDVHFDKKRIKNREYQRILERATLKIEKNPTEVPCENRIKKLVADYVDAYRKAKLGH